MPAEGSVRDDQRAPAVAALVPRHHVIVAADAAARDVISAAGGVGADLIVLVDADGVLAGTVGIDAVTAAAADAGLAAIADADPPSTRPNATAEELVERVREEGLAWVAVTTAAGRFLGVIDGQALLDLARHDRLP